MGLRARAVALGLVLALGGACRDRRERGVAGRADAAARAIVLAGSSRALRAPEPEARVVVGPGAVGFDDAAWFMARAPGEREQLRAAARPGSPVPPTFEPSLVSATVDAIARGPVVLPALRDTLRAEDEWRRGAGVRDDDGLAVNVRLDRQTPFALVERVLATIEGADFRALPVVAGAAGEGVLRFPPDAMGEGPCPTAAVHLGPRGVTVSIEASTGAILAAPASPGGPPGRPAWQRLVAPRGGGPCPAIPRRDGAVDGRALAALLREVAAALPTCDVEVIRLAAGGAHRFEVGTESRDHAQIALVAAAADTPWLDVVAAADAAAAAGFPDARLRGPTDEPSAASCDSAIPVAALRDRFR
jgi:hypothetical protein